jgi:hypothetical protein
MRCSLLVLTVVSLGAVSGVAHAQDAPPPPAGGPPPPAAAPPPPPPPGYYPPPAASEERTANNAIYLELLGPGLFYSINYDRAFGDFAARIGFSYFSVSVGATSVDPTTGQTIGASEKATFLAFPLTVSYLGIGSKSHMLELGAGVTIFSVGAGFNTFGADNSSGSGSAVLVAPTGIIGYRMQPKDGGFFFKIGLSPQFYVGGSTSAFWPAPHIGLGGTF